MKNPSNPPSPSSKSQRPENEKWKTIDKANTTQLSLQIRLVDGSHHTWPYTQLCHYMLKGGRLDIWFSEHVVKIHGRHLDEADDGLRLQSLVSLSENGTRRKDELGEEEIPENQPAIDSISIEEREKD